MRLGRVNVVLRITVLTVLIRHLVNEDVVIFDQTDVFTIKGEASTSGSPLNERLIVVVTLFEDHVGGVEQACTCGLTLRPFFIA